MDHYGFLWPYCVAALVGDCSSLVVPGVLLAHPWSQSVFEDALELGSHLWCDGKGLGQPFVTLYLQRVSREWAEHSSQLEEQQVPVWHSAVDTNMTGHEHIRWRGAERGLAGGPGHGHVAAGRGGMAGQGSFAHGGHSQGYIVPSGRLEGGGMASQDQGGRVPNPHPHPHFTRRY